MARKIEIIENIEEEKEKFEKEFYGTVEYFLTEEHLKALKDGKCLATEVNAEYAVFIVLD